jgi:hypothetical protein
LNDLRHVPSLCLHESSVLNVQMCAGEKKVQ